MKKINRFYLIIAGLIMSRTYSVMAFSGMQCSKIVSCCDSFPNPDDSDIKEATCCSSEEYPTRDEHLQCWDVCLNKFNSRYCNADSYCGSITVQESYDDCYHQLSSGEFLFQDVWDKSLCNNWNSYLPENETYCMGEPNINNIRRYCCGNDDNCYAINTGAADFNVLCGSGCMGGYYLSGQHCLKCPQYAAHWDGNGYTYNSAESGGGTGGILTCYIPSNISLTDQMGRYVYSNLCYYGS